MIIEILLVDDEVPFAEAMARRLNHRGYKVHVAHTGQDGIKVLENEPGIDVIILDINMPGHGGIESLRRIKKLFPLVEILILTGHRTFDDAIEGMKLGAFDYLMKIFDLEELIKKIRLAKARRDAQLKRIVQAEIHENGAYSGIDKPEETL